MLIYRFLFLCFFSFSLFSEEHIYLKTPNLSEDNIVGTNVGIRPFRKSGVRLEEEDLQDKLIIHNYGYGGSGLTLSFGGAKEVLDIIDRQKTIYPEIAVLGGGVIGLTTAYDLLKRGYVVHLYSDDWTPNLTSNVAAGIWTPLSFFYEISEDKKILHQCMLKNSETRFLQSTGECPEFAGIKPMCCYSFTLKDPQEDDEVVVHLDNGTIKKARRFYQIGIDGKLFMEDLFTKVKEKGAILKQQHFECIEDIFNLKEEIIINCLSMGSREIFNDQDFLPVRGQIVYFTAQEGIDFSLSQAVPDNSNMWVAIYPWNDRLILGGIYEYGEEELTVDPEVIDMLIHNAKKCLSE